MQKSLLSFLLITFFACGSGDKKESRYTEGQISSLQLDSTKILMAKTDSMIIIDLNPFLHRQHFDFETMVKEIKLIPLETTDESLVDDIYKIVVTDSNIYIMDDFKGRGLIIFDREGKFVKRMSHGQGPGELNRLYDIAYDTEKNELITYQHSFLLFFTPSGKYIRQMKLPFGFFNFTILPNGYIFKALDSQGNGHLGTLEDYTLFITDKKFKLKSVGMYYPPKGKVITDYDYIYSNNKNIHITQPYNDTIYEYINEIGQLNAKYVLNYSKKKLPDNYLNYNSFADFDKLTRQNDYYFYIGRYRDTKTHHVFFLENSYLGTRTVIYRDKRSGNMRGGTDADFNVNEIPPIAFPIGVFNNYFISSILPIKNDSIFLNSSFISSDDKLKIKGLTEENNPVLVFFQLKDF